MKRWILPLILGLAFAAVSYQVTLVATPYVLMGAAMKKIGKASGKINEFAFGNLPTPENQPVVRPSPDLSYSSCTFDISKGMVLIDVPSVPDHYWSVSIFDARTDVAAVRGDRETGGKPARLALMRHIEPAPAGYEAVKVDYNKGIALVRILVNYKADYPAVDAIRRQATCKLVPSGK